MGVVKNDMLNNEVDDWINSHDSEDMSFYESEDDDEYLKMMEQEAKADAHYEELEKHDELFGGFDYNNEPNFKNNNVTLGGCLKYILFNVGLLLILYFIVSKI